MRRINAAQLAAQLAHEKPVLLDVRKAWEFEICHIDGSINVPMGQISSQLEQLIICGMVIPTEPLKAVSIGWLLFSAKYSANIDGILPKCPSVPEVSIPR